MSKAFKNAEFLPLRKVQDKKKVMRLSLRFHFLLLKKYNSCVNYVTHSFDHKDLF